MNRARSLFLIFGPFLAAGAAQENEIVVIRGGAIHTISSGVVENGIVRIENGKIAAVGTDVAVPDGARVIEARDRVVTPGAIDARSTIGVSGSDRWETAGPVMPQLRVIESFALPESSEWLRGGVTAVYVTPGPENVVGGLGAVVKLAGRPGAIAVKEAAGMSVSLGEIPKQSFGEEAPQTRMGAVYLLRDALIRAREHLAIRNEWPDRVAPALGMETLSRVFAREFPLRIQANTPDDIMNAVRVGREFEIPVVIDVGVGAHRVAAALAEAGIPVVVGPNMMGAGGGGRFEFATHTEENAARLHRAGVRIALSTDDDGGRSVVLEAAISMAHGLPREAALRAITLGAAEILGVADRLGSIEAGKDADLVIWNGHPLDTWGEADKVLVDGRVVFEREEKSGLTSSPPRP